MTIKKIENYAEVMFSFPVTIKYFAEVESAGGIIFCGFEEDEPIAIICLKKLSFVYDVSYIYVNEKYRNRGIAGELIKYTSDTIGSLHFRILTNNEYAPACERIAEKFNMRLYREATFYKFEVDEESKRLWEEKKPEFLDHIKRLEKRNGLHKCVSFAEADKSLLDKLKNELGRGLSSGLNPFTLPDIDRDFSMIVTREVNGDTEVVGFYAVRKVGKKMIHEISSAKKGRTIVYAVPQYFDRIFESEIEKVSCVVYNDNPLGKTHVAKHFGFLFIKQGGQSTYQYKSR